MKKRIRFLNNSLEFGGAERVLVNLLRQLPQEKYEITLVTVTGGAFLDEIPNYIKHRQIIKKNSLYYEIIKRIVYKLPAWLFNMLYLQGSYDAEIAYMEGFPTRMMAYKCKKEINTYTFVHSDFSKKLFVETLYKSNDECLKEYRSFKETFFVSEAALAGFESRIGKLNNKRIVHNIIDFRNVNLKSKLDASVSFKKKGIKIISVGRLVDVKGFDRLVRIAKRLYNQTDIQIIIVGDGPEKERLKMMIEENGVSNIVSIAGFIANPYPVIIQADLYICSSKQEAYSTSVAEAVGLGIPVLTTECAGMHEILDESRSGVIVENNEDALFAGLFNLVKNHDLLIEYKRNAEKERNRLLSMNQLGDYEGLF